MYLNRSIIFITAIVGLISCSDKSAVSEEEDHHGHEENSVEVVHLSDQQVEALGMKTGKLPMINMSDYVESNGQLKVPPQNEAKVTAIIGANITSIEIIEGDIVKKGEILAWLTHPDLIKVQAQYLEKWNQLQYLEDEYNRQKNLYEEKVGSGREYQKIKADYNSTNALVKSYEAQMKLLGLNLKRIQNGTIYERIPVYSPIKGSIRSVEVMTGQYVSPQAVMFEIVNIDHIHADLMVFEKDVHKVKIGQKVIFNVETIQRELTAKVYSVGKTFEQDPKAIHLHAEIENKEGLLIPGMYVKGRILTGDEETTALPEEAIVRKGNNHIVFIARKRSGEWEYQPVEVKTGIKNNGWVEIKPLETIPDDAEFAWNNAYYLLAEMDKGEGGGHHH
ncbi:efflux RND transporter periplasmic adaptor subunit [Mangrovivirga sp. M17]|uniref:Efflux RND transporter periplasmic adaptor subunit n=1 Tax=Mangrovivirga halotolerans TaxID=2993936 RepID=A0ABT3RRE5_9BACT|nr:efflux RND transporter periplasmic adaptor subunit [Mangrovivirga halotolerans]MCX2744180.1 efflux RND transporter periplasmic adaptor subunit [Mangrovivirga halotolerans]